jgi:TolC family type I secretion outer membrane protein
MRWQLIVVLGLLMEMAATGSRSLAAEAPQAPMIPVVYEGPELTGGGPEGVTDVVPPMLSLEKAVELALEYNPDVAASAQGVMVTDAQVIQAISRLMPRVSLEANRTTPVDLPEFAFQSSEPSWETTVFLSQPLYAGGALRAGARAARDFLRGSEGAYRRTQQEIAFAVRSRYYTVLSAEWQVRVQRQTLELAEESLRVARLRYEAGVAPEFDVLSAEARVARTEQGVISAGALRDTAWATLSTAIGAPIPAGTELSTPRAAAIPETSPEALRAEALVGRPDLLTAEALVAAERGRIAVARAGRYPLIAANAGYTFRENVIVPGDVIGSPGTDIVVSQDSGFIALSIGWSLFNGGQVEGEVREAEARMRRAQNAVRSLRQQVELDVRSAYLAVAAARAQVEAARKEVTQQEEAYRISTIRYQEGVGTSVELLTAETDLEDARTRLNRAVFDLALAVARLDLALGRDTFLQELPASEEGVSE